MDVNEQIVPMLERQQVMLEHIIGTLDKHTIKLDQHSEKLDQHSEILEQHGRILEQHSQILEQHSEMFVSMNVRLDRQDDTLVSMNARLDRQDDTLVSINARLDQHGQKLDRHSGILVGIQGELAELNTKADLNHKLVVAEIRGHKQETHDKLDEHKKDNDERFTGIQQDLHTFISSTDEYKHAVRLAQRQQDLTDRDVTKAFERIEYLEKVFANPRE